MGGELAFLWHLHQPPYRDPDTGTYLLPWVRLHAMRGYLDLAAIHQRFPEVRSTVNFSPILVEQLEEYAKGTAKDRFLEIARIPAADLSESERIFLVERFFMVSWDQGVRPLPRYGELLQKRGEELPHEEMRRVAKSFGEDELRDLQVLFHLAWMGFFARSESEVVSSLIGKGRDYTEADKEALFDEEQRLMEMVLPLWKQLQAAGSVELSCSPYAHPILPLLCDTDAARIALPRTPLPPRMRAKDDAAAQVHLGREVHRRAFGQAPRGMWPSEGSVSPEALEVMSSQGVQWAASDEEVLFRSLRREVDPALLYCPWRVQAGDEEIQMVFRDRRLSDRVGFTYARATAKDAVDDLLGEVSRIASGFQRQVPLVSVILDGENPWEYYPGSGEAFLTELYSRLERRELGIESVSLSQALSQDRPHWTLEEIHAGSWIEGSFRIWMGHQEDVAAWSLVGETKRRIDEAASGGVDEEKIAEARRHLYLAEGSDWFWWYGEDFLTETRAEFDLLFRHFIQSAHMALDLPPPATSLEPLIPEGRSYGEALVAKDPSGFIHPKIDGLLPSYWDWLGAGLYIAGGSLGQAMYRGGGMFERLYFGFDLQSFFLRLDPGRGEGGQFIHPNVDGIALEFRTQGQILEVYGGIENGEIRFRLGEKPVGRGVFRKIFEMEIGFEGLGLKKKQRFGFAIRAQQGKMEVQRLPDQGFLTVEIPDESFEETMWKV